MSLSIPTVIASVATVAATEAINTHSKKNSAPERALQIFGQQFMNGVFGGGLVAPFFYAREVIKRSVTQFPSEKTFLDSIKQYAISNRGFHWERFARMQERFTLRGGLLGLAVASAKYTSHKYRSESTAV